MKVGIIFKGKVISKEPIEIGTEKLKQLRTTIDGLGLKGLPKDWRFLKGDDEQPLVAESRINAALLVVNGNLAIGAATTEKPSEASASSNGTTKPSVGTVASTTKKAPAKSAAATKPKTDGSEEKPAPSKDKAAADSKPQAGATKAKAGDAGSAGAARSAAIKNLKAPEPIKDTTPNLKADTVPPLDQLFGEARSIAGESSSAANLTVRDVLNTAYEKGLLPVTFKFDQTLSAELGSALLHVPSKGKTPTPKEIKAAAADLTARLRNYAFFECKAFERASFSKLFTSSAYDLAYSVSGKAPLEGATVEATSAAKFEAKTGDGKVKRKRNVYVATYRKATRAEINLPQQLIRISEDTQRQLRAIIDEYERKGNEDAAWLLDQLNNKPALVASSCTLGGILYAYEQHEVTDDLEHHAEERKAAFTHSVDIALEDKVKAGTTTEAGISAGSTTTSENNTKVSGFSMEANGGDTGFAQTPAKWVGSLSNPGLWAVIGVDGVLPIWEYLEESQRRRWREAARKLRSHLDALIEVEQLKADRMAELLEAQIGCIDSVGSVKNGNIRREIGVPNLPGAVAGKRVDVNADWGYLGRTVSQGLYVPEGHVITYVRIWTTYDPPGTYKITSGGVLSTGMELLFEQEKMRNMSWYLEYQTAKPSAINVSDDYPRWVALVTALHNAVSLPG